MEKKWVKPIAFLFFFLSIVLVTGIGFPLKAVQARAASPTPVIPTVTSTPGGPMVTVRADAELTQINVRNGPGTDYERIGVLLVGQQAPAKGRTEGGKWILIEYPGVPGGQGWVYTSYVDVSSGALPIVEPPPTPTPLVTMTIDPTLAAKFVITSAATRLPTFTPPPPLVIPTFAVQQGKAPVAVPMGMVIIGLAAVGGFIGLFTLAQNR